MFKNLMSTEHDLLVQYLYPVSKMYSYCAMCITKVSFLSILSLIVSCFSDVMIGGWEDGADDNEGDQIKRLSYNLSLTNPLGPKSSKVEETQVDNKHECMLTKCL